MKRLPVVLFLVLCTCIHLQGKVTKPVAPEKVAQAVAKARPGDTITIADGQYRDVNLEIRATGTEGKPVVVQAQTQGRVIFSGGSTLRLAGEWVTVSGLMYRECRPQSGSVIEFRLGRDVANHCRVTDCVIDSCNPEKRDEAYSYVLLYGRHNRFDHNSLLNKLNISVTLIVILDEERNQQNFHEISANYFGPRPVFGSNGAETIRVGTSQQAYKSSNTIISGNFFDRCNGEVEIVSIKSCDNTVGGNIFLECQGVVALRHGDRNTVENNTFIGNNVKNTGGVRVVNAGHTIRGNTFYRLAGGRFFSAMALMSAVPNSLPNRYCLVENVTIEKNTFVDCANIEFGTGRDEERTLPPQDVRFTNNVIINPKLPAPYRTLTPLKGFVFEGNEVLLSAAINMKGFANLPKTKYKDYSPEPVFDDSQYGASWDESRMMTIGIDAPKRTIGVYPGQDNLPAAVDKAADGDTIELSSEGEYILTRPADVSRKITIRAAKGLRSRPVVKFAGTKKANMITILDGGGLTVSGILFSGELAPGKAMASAGISTGDGMIQPYNLTVDNCEFADYGESNFFAIRGMKNTFADRVVIRNCLFRDLSGDAINFAAEKDDAGRYNADEVVIENCAFSRILGLAVNIYRGGSDESTAGPYVTIRHCTFYDVCNKERGSVMRLIGPQVMTIADCLFYDSGRGGATIRLDEATWEVIEIRGCNFWNSGRVISMTGKVVKGTPLKLKPVFVDASAHDFRLAKGSPLTGKATDGKNIGIN